MVVDTFERLLIFKDTVFSPVVVISLLGRFVRFQGGE
jgi:hypothetical protein